MVKVPARMSESPEFDKPHSSFSIWIWVSLSALRIQAARACRASRPTTCCFGPLWMQQSRHQPAPARSCTGHCDRSAEVTPFCKLSTKPVAALRSSFILAAAVLLLVTLLCGQWQGHLKYGGTTFIVDLPRAPVWSAPTLPTYATFQSTFTDLPTQQPANSRIIRYLKWDWMFFEFALWLWGITAVVGLLYVGIRGSNLDPFLDHVWHVGIGMTLAAFTSLAIWIVFGGWGPPFPIFFAVIGVVGGLLAAGRRSGT